MTIGITDSKNYTDIANAIREKSGDSGFLAPGDMAQAIADLPSGSGGEDVIGAFITDTLTEIKSDVSGSIEVLFTSRQGLKIIDLPNITRISGGVFVGCKNLNFISMQNLERASGGFLSACTNLETAIFPKLETVSNNTFENCVNLKNVDVYLATSIYGYAFRECRQLETIRFKSLNYIYTDAFYNCTSLKALIIEKPNTVCNLVNSSTSTIPEQTQIYVADIYTNSFKNATNWSKIADRIHLLSELPEEYQ